VIGIVLPTAQKVVPSDMHDPVIVPIFFEEFLAETEKRL
jgi:hypothetical protein